jgi:putative membrane protein
MADERPTVTGQSDHNQIATELSMRRTGMSFQRTRMSADRTLMSVMRTSLSLVGFGFTIYQFFGKLQEGGVIKAGAGESRTFGSVLVLIGVGMLLLGIIYHLQFMNALRRTREEMRDRGLIYGASPFPPSLTLIIAVSLFALSIVTSLSMGMHIGPFR